MRYNLRNLRNSHHYTQRALADELSITDRQYQRLEAGTSDGSMKLWEQMAKMFNTTIDHLREQAPDNPM